MLRVIFTGDCGRLQRLQLGRAREPIADVSDLATTGAAAIDLAADRQRRDPILETGFGRHDKTRAVSKRATRR